MWKNVHPVYGAGILTHDLRNINTRPGLPPVQLIVALSKSFFLLSYPLTQYQQVYVWLQLPCWLKGD